MMKINLNYFIINNKLDNLKYFLKRGHLFPLLWDRIKWYWFPRLNIVSSFPQTVDVETSLSCQLKCPMCTRAQMDSDKLQGIMDFSLYKKIVDECAEHRVFSVKLSWRGEPTLNPHLVEMVQYAKQKGVKDVAFLTNGGLIDEEFARKLINAGLDWISFSIDGLYEDYESIRYPIKFDQIVNTVKTFHRIKKAQKRIKPLVRIQTISSVIQKRPEYFDFWNDLVDRIAVIAEQHRENPERIKHDPDYICQSPFQRVFITWDGTVVPCHGDYFLHHNMGNVKDTTISEIWNSEKFKNLMRDMRAKKRLTYKACSICPDGGEYIGDYLEVNNRKIAVIKYLEDEGTKTEVAS